MSRDEFHYNVGELVTLTGIPPMLRANDCIDSIEVHKYDAKGLDP
jgi:hypothetical protein